MRRVVADTGPLNYLVLTGDIELLPKLFQRVLAPQAVRDELADGDAPAAVRAWIAQTPPWLEVRPNPDPRRQDATTAKLDEGERTAIALATAVKADLVLMDHQDGVAVARRKGLAVTGTLGVLDLAARRGLIDLAEAFKRLKATSFYYRQGLLDALLAQQGKRGEG
jgi:predicted nucleic acid-binding protein